MVDVIGHNRYAWDRLVEQGDRWARPVSAEQVADARNGRWDIILTPTKPVPKNWFGELKGASVLCLAAGGGQQGPILSAVGADVTVFDNSPAQLAQDRLVAERDGLDLRLVEGDMRDLSSFTDQTFDLIVHPVSNVFVPDVRPVWKEAFRVLKQGGCLLSGIDNAVIYIFDPKAYEQGSLVVAHSLPYSDADLLSDAEIASRKDRGIPLEFGHTLEDQIGGQIDAGFTITGFYEDRYPPEDDELLDRYMPTFIATRAYKIKIEEYPKAPML
ncbi:class I SAM-dependent methyltransferase [bacterium]|nr:class I SAM-dependent methyltransferase [bacterium]